MNNNKNKHLYGSFSPISFNLELNRTHSATNRPKNWLHFRIGGFGFHLLSLFIVIGLFIESAHAVNLLNRRIKATGILKDGKVVVYKFKYRKVSRDARAGRVNGQIQQLNLTDKTLSIGPVTVEWNSRTRFDQIAETGLEDGMAIKVVGIISSKGRILAKQFEPGSSEIVDDKTIQVLGTISDVETLPDGALLANVMGFPVLISARQVSPALLLTRKQDDRRPDQQRKIELFGRPLTIGGEIGVTPRYRGNFNLDPNRNRDRVRLDTQAEVELFYPWSANIAFFLEGQASYEQNLYRGNSSRLGSEALLRRGQMWAFWGDIENSGVSLQVGRQNFRERREWWWDNDLDAVRIFYDQPFIHAEAGISQQLFPVSTADDGIPSDEEGILRVLSHVNWLWTSKQELALFFLYQDDHSSRPALRDRVSDDRVDPVDGDFTWLGIRTFNRFASSDFGEFDFWADTVWIDGEEITFDFDDSNTPGFSQVDAIAERHISGWALDLGLIWEIPVSWRPALTFGYAVGTRDFRQTGLQDNNNRFRSVSRFRYYGELLRPELSNLHIWTVALTLPILQNSSVTALYHYYRQVEPRPFLRDGRLNADPNGISPSIGHEWDLVIGLEEWQNWEFELVTAVFKADSAYGSLSGNIAVNAVFKINYNF